MAKGDTTDDSAATSTPAAPATSSKDTSSGNIVKRNQTSDNIEISLPGRILRVEPYGMVQMNEAEWNSPACKPYQNILK